MRRSTLHFWVGFIGIILFALQGQYMQWELGRLEGFEDGPRMAYRSSHVYFFLASALNLVRGIYPSRFAAGTWSGKLEMLASPLMLVAPVAFVASFFVESPAGVDAREIKLVGNVMILAACVFMAGAVWFDRRK